VITVAILNWDGKDLIRRCVDSVLWQTRKPDEIILIENDPKDTSWKLVKNDVTRIVHADNRYGFITGLNTAFSVAKRGWVLFMCNDMLLFPGCIEKMIGNPGLIVSPTTYDQMGYKYRYGAFTTGCFMMHTDIFKIVGEFDTNLAPAYYEDVDYAIRAKRFGFTIEKNVGKCLHWANYSFSKRYTKRQMSQMCRSHWWYVMKKQYLSRVFPFLYTGRNVSDNN
jgi:GT2 family glycosyltransferase